MKKRSLFAVLMTISSISLTTQTSQAADAQNIENVVIHLERQLEAQIGVAVINIKDNSDWYYKADQRFPMASTFKLAACAALLNEGKLQLDQSVDIDESDIQEYAPVTKKLVGKKVTASELCAITMRTSDNTAANKVLEVLGGPDRITAFVRSIGDDTTNFNRYEPDLNEGKPGDERDTTTPRAMAFLLKKLMFGTSLSEGNKSQLKEWMIRNEVSGPLLRAGIPQSWVIADRSGAGGYGTRGIAAVMWPDQNGPIITTIYITQTQSSMEERNSAIATIGKAIAAGFAR